MFLLTKSINVEVSDTYRTQMVIIEASMACRWYMWYRLSKYTQKSSCPWKKSWSRYLTPNIFISSFNIRRYRLCKLNICVHRLISCSSVTKGFPCSYGATTGATGISFSSPLACSSVNPVLARNCASCRSASCRSGNLGTRRARVLFVVCLAEEWSCHISSDFSACGPLLESDHSPNVSFSVLVGCLGLREAFFLPLEVPFLSSGGL